MNVRGTVADEATLRTVSTSYGESELAEVPVVVESVADGGAEVPATEEGTGAPMAGDGTGTSSTEVPATDDGADPTIEEAIEASATDEGPTTVTLWGKWTESAELLEPGMELLVTDAEEREFRGQRQFSTTGDSYVVVEPSFLVNVTAIRSWAECPRLYYLNKLSGVPLNYPVLKGTLVHEVFGDLLRGRELEASIADRIDERGLELGLLGESPESVAEDVRTNARAIEGWLEQGRLTEADSWRSEQLLISEQFGIRGRADAVRRGAPVELKTGKNLRKEPRFKDKVQAACYALLLEENGGDVDTGTLLYTKNSALDRNEETGDLTPAKEFSMGDGLLKYVVRLRNEIAAMEYDDGVPTGHEGNATCEYCFERDTCMVVSGRLDQESKAGAIGSSLPAEELAHFERLYRAIEAERAEIHREYAKLWEQTADERAADDRALIDLEFLGASELDGGRWELRARRRSGATSKLREGDLVLASDGHPVRGSSELARIERLGSTEPRSADEPGDRGPRAEVVLTADEPVEVSRLDVYPSELTTDRLLVALHDALLKGETRRKDVLFGRAEPTFEDGMAPTDGGDRETFVDNNAAQDAAVGAAVGARDFAVIHGPPGTGKTYTVARTVRAMVERGERVLLSAFTNRAVDNMLEALLDDGSEGNGRETSDGGGREALDPDRIVRVGTESGVRSDMQPYRLGRSGDPDELVETLRGAQVVAATTATCGSRTMSEESFDVALVDEAAQLTEPGTYAAINLADRFVLVGDHRQLPPVVRAETELSESLFERLVERYPDASVMLDRQYRMNQRIQAFASAEFYDGKLRPATAAVAGRTLDDLAGVSRERLPAKLRDPVAFLDVPGDDGRHTDGKEAARIADVIDAYETAGLDPGDVGVIAPFRAQVSEIRRHVPEAVTVDTVDRFQGSSEEVIVVSFVASGELEGPIFEDYRRINVALTRARRALVLVGDATALDSDPVYRRMLAWARR